MQYWPENTTSAAVTGVPSDHFSPSCSFQVTDFRSSAMPPFSSVGISAARRGTCSPSGLMLASGSSTMLDAISSLVPPER